MLQFDIRKRPEQVLQSLDVRQQINRIQCIIFFLQLLFGCFWNTFRRHKALIGRLSAIIFFDDLAALASLPCQLQGGLKEINVQAQLLIQGRQDLIGLKTFEAVVSDKLADDGAVFLFYITLVVLFVGSRAGKGDFFIETIR